MRSDLRSAGPIMSVATASWRFAEPLLVAPMNFCGGLQPVGQFTAPSGAALLANLVGPFAAPSSGGGVVRRPCVCRGAVGAGKNSEPD